MNETNFKDETTPELIRYLRAHNLTRILIANALQVSWEEIDDWEREKSEPTTEQRQELERLAIGVV